ncbi:glycoside hydrolase family 25 protein [Pisolithus croceorrhizus]|nr:glycoside hydrolase family 25 protein [Pisolithus croceorrhizus]
MRLSPDKHACPQGIDVSNYQRNIDWTTVANNGISFVYIKATEGTSYISPSFRSQYIGATDAGLIRGGYHFARPDKSDGATQANFFLAHGDFSNTYQAATGRDWWSTCTGDSTSFANDNPLWIADWSSTLRPLPGGWTQASFWQYADSGQNPGDADLWNGDMDGLRAMALGF